MAHHPTQLTPPTSEELAYCPFCLRRRSRKKRNTPHLHIECSNKHLTKTRFTAAKILHQAFQPIWTLLDTAPTPHLDFTPDALCCTIRTSLLTLDTAPIPTTTTFETAEPTVSPPQQRRIPDHRYWQRVQDRLKHVHHNIGQASPEWYPRGSSQ